jgi:hypothetical protein
MGGLQLMGTVGGCVVDGNCGDDGQARRQRDEQSPAAAGDRRVLSVRDAVNSARRH